MMLLGDGFRVDQVGLVVSDLEGSIERYSRTFSCGPWSVWTYGPARMAESTFRGEPGRFEIRIALAGSGPQVELIEPLSGPSIHREWLDEHGEGVHHLGMRVPDLAPAVGDMQARGYEVLQAGRGYGAGGDGGFAYFDTVADVGVILELIEVPKVRRPPEAVLG